MSLMEATADRSCLHSVQMILSKHDSRTKDKVICNQNLKIQTVVDAYRASLRDLEVALVGNFFRFVLPQNVAFFSGTRQKCTGLATLKLLTFSTRQEIR